MTKAKGESHGEVREDRRDDPGPPRYSHQQRLKRRYGNRFEQTIDLNPTALIRSSLPAINRTWTRKGGATRYVYI